MITVGTLIRFLVGSPQAIRTLAASSATLWLGLLFVLSASFAREYDRTDLAREPWHLLIPVVASVIASYVLYRLVVFVTWFRGHDDSAEDCRYRPFLSLFWMTAPIAWIYAIPVERFLTAEEATSANLFFLLIVSTWRVLLVARIVSVLFQTSFVQSFVVVMLFADTVIVALAAIQPTPSSPLVIIAGEMSGGTRLNPDLTAKEVILRSSLLVVSVVANVTLPFWLIGVCVTLFAHGIGWSWSAASSEHPPQVARDVWWLAIGSVAVWALILPWTQPPRQHHESVGAMAQPIRSDRPAILVS